MRKCQKQNFVLQFATYLQHILDKNLFCCQMHLICNRLSAKTKIVLQNATYLQHIICPDEVSSNFCQNLDSDSVQIRARMFVGNQPNGSSRRKRNGARRGRFTVPTADLSAPSSSSSINTAYTTCPGTNAADYQEYTDESAAKQSQCESPNRNSHRGGPVNRPLHSCAFVMLFWPLLHLRVPRP